MTKIQRDKGKRDAHKEEAGIYLSGRWSFSFDWRSYQNMKMKRRREGEGEKRWEGVGGGEGGSEGGRRR